MTLRLAVQRPGRPCCARQSDYNKETAMNTTATAILTRDGCSTRRAAREQH